MSDIYMMSERCLLGVCDDVRSALGVLQALVGSVSLLDMLYGFAQFIADAHGTGNGEQRYVRPVFVELTHGVDGSPSEPSGSPYDVRVPLEQEVDVVQLLVIENGRHPIMERSRGRDGKVHANSIAFSSVDRLRLVYGANMAGKSTLLQQTGLIVLLAHAGMFVPATFVCLTPIGKVFAHLGARENLVEGRSHFMSESVELAHILSNANPRSLVLLDEVGRATSTQDGVAIAYAVAEELVVSSE